MTLTKYRFFGAWAFEKEEAWLNEMSKKGYQLQKVSFLKFVFEENSQQEYIYRVQMLEQEMANAKREEYIEFVEDTGAEYLTSYFNWVYFRKVNNGENFELFSDIESRRNHLKNSMLVLTILGIVNVMNGFSIIHRSLAINIIGVISISVGALLLFSAVRVYYWRQKLSKERNIHE